MSFWPGFLLLLLFVLALPLVAFLRHPRAEDRKARDLAVHRRQLAELEEELASGLIEESEATAARIEIERRILRLAGEPAGSGERRVSLIPALALYGGFIALGAALYLADGRPDLAPQPAVKARDAQEEPAATAAGASMAELVDRLAARLEKDPTRLDGWQLLGRSAMAIGRPALAVQAWSRAIELDPDDATLYASLGEALFEFADGHTTPAVRLAFEEALRRDPDNAAARFYAGVAAVEDGKPREAIAIWRKLLASAPADAPWRESVRVQLARLEAETKPRPAQPGLDAATLAAAASMTPEAREKMIRAMVDRLAARLADHPEDVRGWLELARARTILKDDAGAREALLRAREHAPPELRAAIDKELESQGQ